jgi:predicted nuclease of predicted toxin-antitoxin system
MRFLANENFPVASIERLRQAGHDVAAVIYDSPGAKDSEVLSRAVDEERIVLTFDRDYGELVYRRGKSAPVGIVYFRFDPLFPEEPAERLLELVREKHISLEKKFTVVERGRIRQRPMSR